MEYRSIYNGTLRVKDVGKHVKVVGWVSKKRNLGSLVFIDLRDKTGIIQVIIASEEIEVPDIRNEYVIQVEGVVTKKDVANPLLATGEVEIKGEKVVVLSRAKTPPLIIAETTDALEEVRLKYRYLDLRRPNMQKHMRTRAAITKATREYLDNLDFLEIETPILTKSTPGGARDFLV
ncbi:MAG: Asp-tRNA(Asn)/Glu-tRNA(Gln) amidotransferase GatCAB subunit C, partial [Erysipelotrichaceae bacterium]|nr:Asp-tRNA(Asn)/Glu-tRNA(Gln) amidotransferase GatCAB subunit C [Erysipelotrichaceae bacterium]